MSFQFDLHSAAVSDSHLPCRAHAISDHAVVLKATAQHGRRETTCSRSASSGYHAEFHEVVIRCIPISDAGGQCETKHRLHGRGGSSTLQKRFSRTSSSDISGYHADIHEGHGTVEEGQGRVMTGERHAMCEPSLSVLSYLLCRRKGIKTK